MAKYHSTECYISCHHGKVHCRCGNLSQYNLAEVGGILVPFQSLRQPDSWNAGIIACIIAGIFQDGDISKKGFYDRLENYFQRYVSSYDSYFSLFSSYYLFIRIMISALSYIKFLRKSEIK